MEIQLIRVVFIGANKKSQLTLYLIWTAISKLNNKNLESAKKLFQQKIQSNIEKLAENRSLL
ncbi:hypothetical protein ABIB40_002513 [Pedobacter sp. UYP30]